MKVEPAAWDALLERLGCSDAYLRRGYVESACLLDDGRPAFLQLESEGGAVVFAAVVRSVPDGDSLHDVTTPYGYGGPVAVGDDPPVQEFWRAYEGWCARNDVVSTFVRFHPLFANHEYAPAGLAQEALADTTAWRLDRGDDLLEGMHRHHRRVARKARGRLEVVVQQAHRGLDEFIGLYEATMARREADAFYFFPRSYWASLSAGLEGSLVLFEARDEEGLAAASLCLGTPPWLHYHLGGTSERAREKGAATLLMLAAARWARRRGYSLFHLGGGVGGREDSLWVYKRRFSPHGGRPMRIGKAVHDVGAYLRLTGTEELDLGGFFPAYRRERSASVSARR